MTRDTNFPSTAITGATAFDADLSKVVQYEFATRQITREVITITQHSSGGTSDTALDIGTVLQREVSSNAFADKYNAIQVASNAITAPSADDPVIDEYAIIVSKGAKQAKHGDGDTTAVAITLGPAIVLLDGLKPHYSGAATTHPTDDDDVEAAWRVITNALAVKGIRVRTNDTVG